MVYLGNVAYMKSDYVKARQYFHESLTHFDGAGNSGLHPDLGDVAMALGEYERARKHYEEALAGSEEASAHRAHVRALGGLGDVALATGDQTSARNYYRRALQYATEKTDDKSRAGALVGPGELLAQSGRAELAVEVLALLLESNPWSFEKIRNRAHRLLDALQSELPPAVFAAAQERGRARDLWATVAELLEELGANGSPG